MKRSNPYEAAFEAYLHEQGLCFIAINESRRSLIGSSPVKSIDFILFGADGARLLVDVKGRRFPGGTASRPRCVWECWSTREDIEGLARWAELAGADYQGLLAFVYQLDPTVDLPNDTEGVFCWRGRRYLMRAIAAAEYRQHMRVRSPRWDTVSLPIQEFRQLIKPLAYFTGASEAHV